VRERLGLVVMIAVGLVFLLGSSLALVELGTSRTVCSSSRFGTLQRIGPACTTTGGTSPVVYAILAVAMVIGVICLAAGITVLAVRISAPAASPEPPSPSPWGYQQPSPGGPQAWWDGTRWVMTGSPPPG
jgi:hypothetical protein